MPVESSISLWDLARVCERLCAKTVVVGECWVWTGTTTAGGYGRLWFVTRKDLDHRISWLLSYGDIPDGMCVLHHCDNPPCIRPEHLFIGSHADNMADMLAKGRQRGRRTNRIRPCEGCGDPFKPRAFLLKRGQGRFCSRACRWVAYYRARQ